MFNPSQQDARRFFCETYRKTLQREVLTPLEAIASGWIVQHPEYHADLADAEALEKDYSIEQGKSNPFIHLSLHLSIAEQISIDQPAGITATFASLAQHLRSEHEAHHVIMECLAAMMWETLRHQTPFDGMAYLAAIQKELEKELARIKKPR